MKQHCWAVVTEENQIVATGATEGQAWLYLYPFRTGVIFGPFFMSWFKHMRGAGLRAVELRIAA